MVNHTFYALIASFLVGFGMCEMIMWIALYPEIGLAMFALGAIVSLGGICLLERAIKMKETVR